MKMDTREERGVTILAPRGKIMGGPEATLLHEELHTLVKNDKKSVVIDLSGVDWMNSSGLGILISGLTTLRNHGGELKLSRVTDKIQSLLTITKLVTVFETYDSTEQAVASFR